MIETSRLTSPDDLEELKRDYLSTLTAPIDGMWESFVAAASHWELRLRGERAGCFCVDEEGRLLRFHVVEAFGRDARELFAHVVARDDVRGAVASTVEPAYLSSCLDSHQRVVVHTYLFHDSTLR